MAIEPRYKYKYLENGSNYEDVIKYILNTPPNSLVLHGFFPEKKNGKIVQWDWTPMKKHFTQKPKGLKTFHTPTILEPKTFLEMFETLILLAKKKSNISNIYLGIHSLSNVYNPGHHQFGRGYIEKDKKNYFLDDFFRYFTWNGSKYNDALVLF